MKRLVGIFLALLVILSFAYAVGQPIQVQKFLSWAEQNSLVLDSKYAYRMCDVLSTVFENVTAEQGFPKENASFVPIRVSDGETMSTAFMHYFMDGGLPIYYTSDADSFVMFMFSDTRVTTIVMATFISDLETSRAFGVNLGDGCLFWSVK